MSSHTVPLNTLSLPAPLSDVIVTTVPAGEVSVISRSALKVCVIKVVRFTSCITLPAPDTLIVEVTTAGPVGIAVGVALLALVLAIVGGADNPLTTTDQLSMEPPSPPRSSLTVIVQVPLGSSPIKAPKASSATSGVAAVRFT